MKLIIPLELIREEDRPHVGGKAGALAAMIRAGMNVPEAVCISIHAYHEYVSITGLRDRVALELNRKDFRDMRWEELWDASLRIRNLFLRTPVPDRLVGELLEHLDSFAKSRVVAVRSSAPGEDTARASFAGLHESFVNVRGPEAIIDHVKQVWASLWSDAALLYRQELGLDIEKSAMAVVVQEMVAGDISGIVFGADPIDSSRMVIEAVYGLNQGLVDGTVEPDRWIIGRKTGEIISHRPADRKIAVASGEAGTVQVQLRPEQALKAPLGRKDIDQVIVLARAGADLFGAPQDMEWTFRGGRLYAVQSRPITAVSGVREEDNRPWYLSLRRSYENLRALRVSIEGKLIPRMIREAGEMAKQDLDGLSDTDLLAEIGRRLERYRNWNTIYRDEFIPFAHGIRLFGVAYNNAVRPSDPYEFMGLLEATDLESLKRNGMLEAMADHARKSPQLRDELAQGQCRDEQFNTMFKEFMNAYGTLYGDDYQGQQDIMKLILEMSTREPADRKRADLEQLRQDYLSHFRKEQRGFASDLLNLARASYRMRDNDNIYLGKVRGELIRAVSAFRARVNGEGKEEGLCLRLQEAVDYLNETAPVKKGEEQHGQSAGPYSFRSRQIVGQPSGPGIGRGRARVLEKTSDLFSFQAGEVLICDAIDPSMTIVVPLAAGIVERRGGMLIHGAIIAREYGIPCVTGVPDATVMIKTGDLVTVDGYLGIVIIGDGRERINKRP